MPWWRGNEDDGPSYPYPPYYDVPEVGLADAWAELLEAAPPGWTLGKTTYNPGSRAWQLYAFDQAERVKAGKRIRAWTGEHPTEIGVVREMARCLREISEGRVPR